ncbi:MAG TPA: hypothetical protein DG048_07715 [Pseudoalteromonas sp.]|nr:hypothetical protein [Pseudoalteromonas sp.]|tara:strand:+ start:132 stop:2084 length:1953 start_codon:yes stop_codon:yes gene_type:complete
MTNIRNALMQAAGTAASGDKVYVEDVFSTYLYTSDGNDRTITNSIDLDGEGGLVWIKFRNTALGSGNNALFDTARGVNKVLYSNATDGEATLSEGVEAFNANGFDLGNYNSENGACNYNTANYASWTFRKQEGFFDVVEYTGNGSNQSIAHNLGVTPGFVVVKSKDQARNWSCWHKSIGNDKYILLNTTGSAADAGATRTVNSTNYQIFGSWNDEGVNGEDYVIYLFADGDESDAQIFGDDGDEQIIKTGSYTGNGNNTGPSVTLGFEPQWVLIKRSSASGTDWIIADNMRGMPVTASASVLFPNLSNSEATTVGQIHPTATGFNIRQTTGSDLNTNSETYIYVAIRRGPMKEPSAGTDVFGTAAATTNAPAFKTGNLVDWGFYKDLAGTAGAYLSSRLTQGIYLTTSSTGAKATLAGAKFDFETGWYDSSTFNDSNYHGYGFRRYPKVFDVAVASGTGSANLVSHNLTVRPELIITKRTDTGEDWFTIAQNGGSASSWSVFYAGIQSNAARNEAAADYSLKVTATQYDTAIACANVSGGTYISFLFASLDGISKVGNYTGTGNDLNVTTLGAAARFILIKRIDSSGDWYVYDSARGIVSGNDPYWFMNGGAEVTNTDYIDAHASGFTVTSSAPAGLNASGGTYLYLAFS